MPSLLQCPVSLTEESTDFIRQHVKKKKKKRALNKIQRDQSLIITVSEESRELCLSPFKERKQSLFLSSSADLAFLKDSISLMG